MYNRSVINLARNQFSKMTPKFYLSSTAASFVFLICFYFDTVILNFLNIFYKRASVSHKPRLTIQTVKPATQTLNPENVGFFTHGRIRREVDTLSPVCEQGVKTLSKGTSKLSAYTDLSLPEICPPNLE